MSLDAFQKKIEGQLGKKLWLKINDNRSTMLSVRWEPDCTRVSMHRMFLEAPQNVMEELACYIRQEKKMIAPVVKSFIEDGLHRLDYSHLIDRDKLCTQGKVYNLQRLYDELNREYFKGSLKLNITWFSQRKRINRSRLTFGLYQDPLKLIKVNRLLDSLSVPIYFLRFVIYHEMLHCACPAYIDEKGVQRMHGKPFKEKEKEFVEYKRALKWLRDNKTRLFATK